MENNGARLVTKPHWSHTAIWWLVPVAVIAVYWPCLPGEWIYDDWTNFDRNQPVRDGDWSELITRPYYGHDTTYWRPITFLLMGIGYRAGPFGVHAIAIVVHILAAYVVGSIGRQLLGDRQLALFAALLFALHPVQIESVAWGSALPGVPCALFLLLTVRAVLRWSTGNGKRAPWSAALWLFCALLSKEAGVVAVPLVVVIVFGTGGLRSRAGKIAVSCAAVLLGVVWFASKVAVAGYRPVLGDDLSWVVGTAHMIFGQIAVLLVPWPLTPFRTHPNEVGGYLIGVLAVLTVVACIVLVFVVWRRLAVKWRIAGALTIAPLLLSAVAHEAVGPHPLADRYIYASVAGFVLLVVAAVGRRFVVLGALALAYGVITVMQAHVWHDNHAFVTHISKYSTGDPSVHVLAGNFALQSGGPEGLRDARREFRTALGQWTERTDDFTERQRAAAIAGLAWCDFNDPKLGAEVLGPELIERFRKAVSHHEEYVPAWVGLGIAYTLNGRLDEARAAFESALALDPMCPEAWFNLGRIQLKQRQYAEARKSLREALRSNPDLRVATELLARIR